MRGHRARIRRKVLIVSICGSLLLSGILILAARYSVGHVNADTTLDCALFPLTFGLTPLLLWLHDFDLTPDGETQRPDVCRGGLSSDRL